MTQSKRKYAVVDLEATNPGSNAKIIQVGIVIIEDGEIVTTYETDVNPHEPLDEHIKDLTGLTDERLAQAPDFEQVAREIFGLVEDCIFVAHNVKFDANLLAEALFWEGFELRTPRVDTVELAQIFYPTLDKYNLGVLAEALQIELTHAHTALSDAMATAHLFLKIQDKMRTLPQSLLETLHGLSDCLLYETHLALEEVLASSSSMMTEDLVEVQGLFLRKPLPIQSARKLSQDVEKNLFLLQLEERAGQVCFAKDVVESLKQDCPTFLEAETGLGKTYGYLLAALATTDKKIIVSVPTKILQNQILSQEGKEIERVFHISFHSLKSPRYYLKLDKFFALLSENEGNRLLMRFKMLLLVWLTETYTGDLEEIGQLQRYQSFVDQLSHDGHLSRKSLFYGEDFWQRGQQRAKKSRVIVTNHAYLLTRLEDDPNFVKGQVLIVDEAQKMVTAVENFSRKRLSVTKMVSLIQQQLQENPNLLQRRIMESLQFELSDWASQVQRKTPFYPTIEQINLVKQYLSELDGDNLLDLQEVFAEHFSLWWLEEEHFDHHRTIWLEAARSDWLQFISFLPPETQLLFVSATLSISPKVTIADLLGIAPYRFVSCKQHLTKKQKIWVDMDFPSVAELSLQDYAREITRRLEELLALKKPILVLFTSKELLYEVSDACNLPHLAQGKNGEPVHLKKRFERGEAPILLGTGSFWEGVDFAEPDQMIQVITRLPFDHPKDLFVQKINQNLKAQHKNPFYDYSLPMMILRLQQAVGRTTRHPNQVSAILVLDHRMVTRRYSRQIQESMRQIAPLVLGDSQKIVDEMRHFFKQEQRKKGFKK